MPKEEKHSLDKPKKYNMPATVLKGSVPMEMKIKKMQGQVRPAVEAMIVEAEHVAASESEYMSYEDVFDGEEKE